METSTWINCTGDAVKGDTIRFTEAIFSGSFRNAKYRGDRTIIANILNDSYGAEKQQHTFSLVVVESSGVDALAAGTKTTRKGRNVYKNGTERLLWPNEDERKACVDEKHQRGDVARQARDYRKGGEQ